MTSKAINNNDLCQHCCEQKAIHGYGPPSLRFCDECNNKYLSKVARDLGLWGITRKPTDNKKWLEDNGFDPLTANANGERLSDKLDERRKKTIEVSDRIRDGIAFAYMGAAEKEAFNGLLDQLLDTI